MQLLYNRGMETRVGWEQVWCACCRVRVQWCRGGSEVGGLQAGWGRLWCRVGVGDVGCGVGGGGDVEVGSGSADLQQGEGGGGNVEWQWLWWVQTW